MLGIGAVGLFQLLLAVPVAIVTAALVDTVQLPNAVPATIGWVILWFVLGYAFFSVAFAATAARASRAEETQAEQTVIALIPHLLCFFALFYATESPDAWPARIATFIPISAPFVLPVRAAVSSVALWQVAVAAIMIVSTYVVIRMAPACTRALFFARTLDRFSRTSSVPPAPLRIHRDRISAGRDLTAA